MVALSKPTIEQFFVKTCKPVNPLTLPEIPIIDLSKTDSKHLIVNACQDFGFFKVVNHGIPKTLIDKLEAEATKFFSFPQSVKDSAGPPNPFGYGNKNIGQNGDIGWVEYLLLNTKPESDYNKLVPIFKEHSENFQYIVDEYLKLLKRMACEILELMAEGLKLESKNAFSKMLADEQSDSVFRVNYYPPCPELQEHEKTGNLIGFGEHTDPQIISVLRSNNTSGLEILLKDGNWALVPPDSESFYINVGDSLQVMTNGRFKSIKHRVVTNSMNSRMSMIYFGGPPLNQKIAPLPSLLEKDEESLYNEFTWFEYKKYAYNVALSHNRLTHFEKFSSKI
ncbi:gibberellin 2-beta-dioxygenase 1-like [Rutidosis leptorrhynchoides]|uniref:gibberellin 2-beta-dioxygenase 1-like n=1 Tax=Rutidosis leptorrhynchoides TaxID=125765 RepID=UPI003A998F2E